MDALKGAMNSFSGENTNAQQGEAQQQSGGGGFMDKINSAAGGGKESEKNEDYLDKGKVYRREVTQFLTV